MVTNLQSVKHPPVHVEHDPHPDTAALRLVELLESVEGEKTAADDEERVDAEKAVPHRDEREPS